MLLCYRLSRSLCIEFEVLIVLMYLNTIQQQKQKHTHTHREMHAHINTERASESESGMGGRKSERERQRENHYESVTIFEFLLIKKVERCVVPLPYPAKGVVSFRWGAKMKLRDYSFRWVWSRTSRVCTAADSTPGFYCSPTFESCLVKMDWRIIGLNGTGSTRARARTSNNHRTRSRCRECTDALSQFVLPSRG